jgi:hypothetical protein
MPKLSYQLPPSALWSKPILFNSPNFNPPISYCLLLPINAQGFLIPLLLHCPVFWIKNLFYTKHPGLPRLSFEISSILTRARYRRHDTSNTSAPKTQTHSIGPWRTACADHQMLCRTSKNIAPLTGPYNRTVSSRDNRRPKYVNVLTNPYFVVFDLTM